MVNNRVLTIFEGRDKNAYENSLLDRLQEMRVVRDKLRCQLNHEKTMLQKEIMEVSYDAGNSQAIGYNPPEEMYRPILPEIPTRSPDVRYNRGDLEDIEHECGQQLLKLQTYIDSVKFLKTNLKIMQSAQDMNKTVVDRSRRSLPVVYTSQY